MPGPDDRRLAKACHRQAEAECSGEFYSGQRAYVDRWGRSAELDARISYAGTLLDRRIAKLNTALALMSIEAHRTGDPRGFTLRLRSTDPACTGCVNRAAEEDIGKGPFTAPIRSR